MLLVVLFCHSLISQSVDDAHFDRIEAFLEKYVSDGEVNYSAMLLNNELSLIIEEIETADISNLKPSVQKAFYINAYNLNVISKIINQKSIGSVMDIDGFFDDIDIIVAGRKLSLNGLEKNMIFRKFDDSRLHFVLVCGAKGCPPLASFAYRPDELDVQLDKRTRAAIANEYFVKLVGDSLRVTQLFNWYKSDFGGSDVSIIEYINSFKKNKVSTSLDLQFTDYDWSLNGK